MNWAGYRRGSFSLGKRIDLRASCPITLHIERDRVSNHTASNLSQISFFMDCDKMRDSRLQKPSAAIEQQAAPVDAITEGLVHALHCADTRRR